MFDFPSIDSYIEDTKHLSKEEKQKLLDEFILMMEEQTKLRLRPDLLNGWINKDGDFIKLDELDQHEMWAMKYFSKILNIEWFKVKEHIQEKYKTVNMLDYLCGVGWIKITQWKEDKIPSVVHTLPINENQELKIEKIKIKFNTDLKIIFVPKRY